VALISNNTIKTW